MNWDFIILCSFMVICFAGFFFAIHDSIKTYEAQDNFCIEKGFIGVSDSFDAHGDERGSFKCYTQIKYIDDSIIIKQSKGVYYLEK